jgi:hypothetical protein
LTLSRHELTTKLDELRNTIASRPASGVEGKDLWYDIAEHLELILASCAADDLPWFHAKADALMDSLSHRSA